MADSGGFTVSLNLDEICASLAFAKPEAQVLQDGYIGMVKLDVRRFTDEQREVLLQCLTGYLDETNAYFLSPVVDNQQRPLIFIDQDRALSEAQLRANGLPQQFIYGAFSEYGAMVKYQQAQQVFFKPRKQLK